MNTPKPPKKNPKKKNPRTLWKIDERGQKKLSITSGELGELSRSRCAGESGKGRKMEGERLQHTWRKKVGRRTERRGSRRGQSLYPKISNGIRRDTKKVRTSCDERGGDNFGRNVAGSRIEKRVDHRIIDR